MFFYWGQRAREGNVVLYCTEHQPDYHQPLQTYSRVWNHSPDGFNWGYCGSGPAQLALALLIHTTSDTGYAVQMHQRFKEDVVSRLDHDNWTLTQEEILSWVDAHPLVIEE